MQNPGKSRSGQQQATIVDFGSVNDYTSDTTNIITSNASTEEIIPPDLLLGDQQQEVHHDNSIVYEVLDELDREKSKRAMLESELRKLKKKEEEDLLELTPYERQYKSYENDRNAYKELVDAMTKNLSSSAATAVLMTNKENDEEKKPSETTTIVPQQSLPIHVIRMLEVLPYDPRSIQSTKAKEEVYEWQIYKFGKWQHLLEFFPTDIQDLTFESLSSSSSFPNSIDVERNKVEEEKTTTVKKKTVTTKNWIDGGGAELIPPKGSVFTNENTTKLIKVDDSSNEGNEESDENISANVGNGGGGTVWDLVSGWFVDKHSHFSSIPLMTSATTTSATTTTATLCDRDGWSYAKESHYYLLSMKNDKKKNLCSDHLPSQMITNNNKTKSLNENKIDGNNMNDTKSSDECKDDNNPKHYYRRRRWTRLRSLRSYPYASPKTIQYLTLLYENLRLSVIRHTLSDQLIETKTKLTELESELLVMKEQHDRNKIGLQHTAKRMTDASSEFVALQKHKKKLDTNNISTTTTNTLLLEATKRLPFKF